MLIDKSYYDYDFSAEAVEKKKMRKRHNRTHEETQAVWKRMGFGNLRRPGEPKPTPDELQRLAMEELARTKAASSPSPASKY